MIESPNNPILNLDVQKMQSWIAPAKLMYQGDKGYKQPFRLTNAWNDYQISSENLCFSATKPDGQVIEVENEPDRFSLKDSIWYFLLPDELTQKTGEVPCFFYIKDDENGIVASTTKFSYQVEAKFTDEERSISYVSALERLQKIFQDYIENAKISINNITDSSNQAVQNCKNELKATADNANQLISDWKTELSNQQQKITDLQNAWKTQTEQINADYDTQKQAIKSDAETTINQINTDKKAALKQANDDFQNQLASIQSDYDSWKTSTIADFQKQLDKLAAELKDDEDAQIALKQAIADANQAIEKIQDVDFTKFAHLSDLENYYDKATMDQKLAEAGKLKQISVNGGTPVDPDHNGVANLEIPQPDLSSLETKADAKTVHDSLTEDISKKADSSELSKYAKSVNDVKPDADGNINVPIPDITEVKQDITTVQGQMSELQQSAMKSWAGTLSQYQALTSYDPMTIYFIISDYEVVIK